MIEDARSMILNCINKCKEQYKLFQNRRELRRVEKNFFQNNNISNESSEKYIKYFRRTLGNFIAGNKLLDDSPNVKKFLLSAIKDSFVYYSEQYIDDYLKEVYRELSQFLDGEGRSINDCYISSIPNKDISINNSSKELMIKFKKLNNLPRNLTRTIETCMENEVKYIEDKKKLQEKIKKNSFNKYFKSQRVKIKRNYNNRKIEISQELKEKLKSKKYLIFVDDFSGTGATIIQYFKILEKYIEIDIEIIIICLHSMEKAEEKIEDYFKNSKFKKFYFITNRVKPASRKKYFSTRKDKLKKEIREFETKNFKQQFALGFEATESLVATYDSCPNNTFSSFWYSENSDWSPLFKRSRKQSDALDVLNLDKNILVNEVKTGLKIRKVANEDIEQIIILLCVKLMKDATTTRVAIEIEDNFYYNGDRLQEYLSNKYIEIVYNSGGSSSYSLTSKGKSKLKEYQMSHMTFEKLVEIANPSKAEDSISTDDYSSYEFGLLNKSAE